MLFPRVIPCLLLRNGGLVKTVLYKSPSYVGDPVNAIRIFNDKRVDELIVLDIVASKERREPDFDLIREFATECFMPLCYGGGVTSVGQARKLVNLGVEKVAINSAAISRPRFVSELASEIGSQGVLACIDVKKTWTGRYRLFDSARGRVLDRDPFEHASELVAAGAGEIMVNNVDRDGTQLGYDHKLIKQLTSRLSVPVVACGGASGTADLRAAVKESGASAAAAGSIFVYQGRHRAVLISYPSHAEINRILEI